MAPRRALSRLRSRLSWIAAATLALSFGSGACGKKETPPAAVTTATLSGGDNKAPSSDAVWEEGPAALEKALAAHRPTLLYVSSEWCPPCRAMDANLLSRPAFREATREMARVRIDGDSEGAQAIAERFEARAYPTLLLLDADGQEVFRAHHEVTLEEIGPVLASAAGAGRGFSAAIQRLESGSLAGGDCALFGAVDWSPASGMSLSTDARIAALVRASSRCDGADLPVRARIAAHLLMLAAGADTYADSSAPGAPARPIAGSLLETVFQSDATAWAARGMITTWGPVVMRWVLGDNRGAEFAALRDRWLRAATVIRKHEGAGLDVVLLSYDAVIDLHKLEHGSAPLPALMRDEIEAAVTRVDALAKTPSSRHAVVSNEAYLLRSIGFGERAKDLLIQEIARTDAASHYQTTLSQWAKEEGRRDEALKFAHDAVTSARGRTSRLQWMVNELQLLSEDVGSPAGRALFLTRAAEAYPVLFAGEDAFLGRNAARAGRLAELLAPLHEEAAVKALAETYGPKCTALSGAARTACDKHVAALRTGTL
ncbi:MAG: thioredoxin family protein [Polyangiaceae bacterium]